MRKEGLHQKIFVLISWQQEAVSKTYWNLDEELWRGNVDTP